MLNLCIPTLNRYDLLVKCLLSAEAGTLKPDKYFIIDNGLHLNFKEMPAEFSNRILIVKTRFNLGVARSWNWFIDNVEDNIVLCNDDIEFYEDSLEKLLAGYDENFITYPAEGCTSFSCIQLPRKIINAVGHFDEALSPYYAYFEDNDYHYRMLLRGFTIKSVAGCRVKHIGSATMKNFTELELTMHHNKFREARARYIEKWGGQPAEEKFKVPFDGKRPDINEDGTTRENNS